MRLAILSLALALGACTLPLSSAYAIRLGADGQVRHRANGPAPRVYLGLRLSLISR